MIMMQSPCLAINSCDAPWPRYKMWETINGWPGMNAYDAASQILRVNNLALEQEGSPLANVVINCHGMWHGGGLYLGGKDFGKGGSSDYGKTTLNMDNVSAFAILKPHNIGTLWIVACDAAYGGDGKQFCQALAIAGGCQVVAGDEEQDTGVWGTWRLATGMNGQIDEFEGTVYSFTVTGGARVINPHDDIYTIKE